MWGCCECITALVQILMKLVTVCRRGGDANLDRTTLLRLLLMLGQQLVNWFPASSGNPSQLRSLYGWETERVTRGRWRA